MTPTHPTQQPRRVQVEEEKQPGLIALATQQLQLVHAEENKQPGLIALAVKLTSVRKKLSLDEGERLTAHFVFGVG